MTWSKGASALDGDGGRWDHGRAVGVVRRAKLYFLRDRVGKKTRLKERRVVRKKAVIVEGEESIAEAEARKGEEEAKIAKATAEKARKAQKAAKTKGAKRSAQVAATAQGENGQATEPQQAEDPGSRRE